MTGKDKKQQQHRSENGGSSSTSSKQSGKGDSSTNNHINTKYVGSLSLITFAVLTIAWLTGFLSRLFSVIRFESIIHEFDPW